VEPESLRIHYRNNGPTAEALKIEVESLEHLHRKPHRDALAWKLEKWKQGDISPLLTTLANALSAV
jgi:hypothetical protein